MGYKLEEMKNLKDFKNHNCYYDGYDYWWYSMKDGKKWSIHSVKDFQSQGHAYSHILYWVIKYIQMHDYQVFKENQVAGLHDHKTAIGIILNMKDALKLTNKEIAKQLNLSLRTVERIIHKNKKTT